MSLFENHFLLWLEKVRDAGVGGQEGGGEIEPQFLADQLTLFRPGGSDYARHISTGPPRFLDDTASLKVICEKILAGQVQWSQSLLAKQL